MKKRFLLLALLSSSFLLSSCSISESVTPPDPDNSQNEEIIELSFEINIVGKGNVRAFLNGAEITSSNFSDTVKEGDTITVDIKAETGYVFESAKLNDTNLTKSGNYYTFVVQKGKNILNVTFKEVTTNQSDFTYEVINNNEVAITSFKSTSEVIPNPLIIPDEVLVDGKTYKVSEIRASVFLNQDIEGIKLGANIKTIDDEAFSGLRSLKEFLVDEKNLSFTSLDGILYSKDETTLIKMPIAYKERDIVIKEGTQNIQNYAFNDCLNTESVTLPEGLISIGDYAFTDSSKLTSINFPSTLKSIGDYAFRNIHSLKEINLNEGLETLGDGTFYQTSLEKASFPSTLKEIPLYSFYFCRNLKTVSFKEGLETIGEQAFISTSITSLDLPNSLKTISQSAFELCSSLESVEFNEGLETIESFAFSRANNINSISLPSTLKNIGYNPFSGIARLGYTDNFKVSSNNPYFEIIDNVLFTKGENKKLLSYPFGKEETEYHVPNGTTYLDVDSFAYQNNLLTIYLPTSIKDINSAFRVMYSELSDKPSLTVHYEGTIEEFEKIDLHGELGNWHEETEIANNEIICSDGTLKL